ncbi:MAG: stage III sporulation protein AB [Lachnospiraceae bacterium]|nr:stage III sporulation protein AB [Lachnospiraceae bacterium]
MLKTFGAVLILLATAGFICCMIRQLREHDRQLLLWKEYLWKLQNGMEGWNSLLTELFEELSHTAEAPFAEFFEEMAENLKKYERSDIDRLWCEIAKNYQKQFMWRRDEWEIFLDSGKLLSLHDKEMILKEGKLLSDRMSFFIQKAQKETREREKVSIYLSLSAGIMLILLLV